MKFLITGGAGFIGSNYLQYAVNKYQLDDFICLDDLTYAANYNNIKNLEKFSNFKFIKGNICDELFIDNLFNKEKFDVVINFAAETHVDNSIKNPSIFVKTNIEGVRVLLDASKKFRIKRYHQVSTDEVYGSLSLNDKPFTEKSMINPTSPYSASKASADLLAISYFKTFNLPVTISRCSNNYGPYQFCEKLIPLVITKALNNEFIPVYGTGENIRDWIYVKDHVVGIDLIIRKGKVGETYNLGGCCEKTNIEVINTILKIMNRSSSLIKYVKDRPGHDFKYALDSSKIENELNWERIYNFDVGIKETIDWYIKNREEE